MRNNEKNNKENKKIETNIYAKQQKKLEKIEVKMVNIENTK